MSRAHSRTLAGALLVVAATLTAALPATAAPAGVKLQAERALGAGVRVQVHRGTGRVSWLSGTAARPVATAASLGRPATALAASRAFLDRHAALFGVDRPGQDLAVSRVSRTGGRTFVRFQQEYRGLPVVAGELIVQVARSGDIISVNGEASPDLSLSIRPTIGAGRAQRLAVAATASIERVPARGLRASAPELVVYDPSLAGDPTLLPGARLAWRMDVRGGRGTVNEWMVIDAQRGSVLGAFNQVMEAAPPADATQRICDHQGARAADATNDPLFCDPGDSTLVANPGSSGVTDVTLTFAATEAAYDFYARRFGRNSINGSGMPLVSSVRFCFPSLATACPYPNAQWNGTQMLYGEGWALGDDVVAHELTHGVTSATSKLLYWFQSGAINESLSDIFGELTDQENGLGTDTPGVRWLLGEDMPGGAIRNMANPAASFQGASADRMRSPNYYADTGLTDRGAVHYNSGVGNKAAFLMVDGGTFNGQTVTGIGVDKTAAIWYRAASQLLSSGSDYSDLAGALKQACKDLTGTTPKNKTGGASSTGAVTSANCGQVGKAITATEMTLPPLVATLTHAKLCTTGAPTAKPFNDRIAADGAGWTIWGTNGVWQLGTWYATSRSTALWGWGGNSASDSSVRSKAIKIPATGKTWLAFRNSTNLQLWNQSVEGGVVEYATGPTGPWKDLGSRFVAGKYDGPILSGFGNPLQGRKAFTGMSYGFELSKAELTFLKGKSVYVRFRLATNADTTSFDGWVIDDVRVYQCK